jgi:probable HAF family extracellular repeat protein
MGDAVGVGRDDRGFERAFFLARGSRRPRWLPTLGGAWSVARAVNENRQVVGVSQTATWAWEAFVEDPGGTMRSLGRLGNMEASEAVSINEHGVIVGVSGMLLGIDFHGFVYDRGVMDDLCPWPRSPCGASDINDAGEIAGWYVQFNSPAAYPYPVGVVWLPTSIGRLGAMIPALPGCQGSRAYALNNKSQAVGFSGDRAILWDSRNGTRDLNTMIPAGSGWTLRFALDISDTGHIVGVGELAGRWHSFLLR